MKGLDTYNYIMYNGIVVGGDVVDRERKSSQAKINANARYDKKTYDNVLVKFRKDAEMTLATVKAHAASRGESVNGFIVRAIAEAIARDREQGPAE